MNRIIYPVIFLLILCISGGCSKITDLKPQSGFVKLFPDSSYQTGGGFQLADGNYIVYGFDPDESGVLPKIIKTNQYGDTLWQIRLSSLFHFLTIKPISNGKMLAVGVEDEVSMNFCLIDANGNTSVLPSYLNTVRADPNWLPDFVEEANGDFTVCSYFDSLKYLFPFVLRINQIGNPYKRYVFENSFIDSTNFSPIGITRKVDGYSVAGVAYDRTHPFKGMFYARLDEQYNVVYDSILFDGNAALYADAISEDSSDGSTMLCGETGGSDYSGNLYVRRIGVNGAMEEEILFTGDYENFGKFKDISNTADGGYILTGTVNKYADLNVVSYARIYLLKLDHNLNKEWSREFGSINPYAGVTASQTSDGGYIVSGFERPASYVFTMLLIKTNAYGNIISE
ncbi:MAG TPA: hypothetical protein VE978_18885 [Chitinophagales bacterium]|nr:hypothetical protein [Chitinophagales bacterium]